MQNVLSNGVQQAIGMPGGSELLLILLIVLVVFGHNRIPQLGEALGKGIKNFRKSFSKDEPAQVTQQQVEQVPNPPAAAPAPAPAEPTVEEKLAQAEREKTTSA